MKSALNAVQRLVTEAAMEGADVNLDLVADALENYLQDHGDTRRLFFLGIGEFVAAALAGNVIDIKTWDPPS